MPNLADRVATEALYDPLPARTRLVRQTAHRNDVGWHTEQTSICPRVCGCNLAVRGDTFS